MLDVKDAYRSLVAAPIVSAVAILSLALGIGANTAIFSIVNTLLLRSLPVQAPEELAVLGFGERMMSFTNPIWEQIREHEDLFAGAFAWTSARFNLSESGETDFVDGIWASGRFFDVLGVPAILGRTFTMDDDRRGGGPNGPVAVISYTYWQRRFGGSADVVGRTLTIDRVPFTIVGVTPPGFFGTDVGRSFDVAIPLGAEPLLRGRESMLDRRTAWWLRVMVRRKPGQSLDAATAAIRGVQPRIREATIPTDYREENKDSYLREAFTLIPAATGSSYLRTQYQRPLLTILVVVGLVLLIACANIANLLLARSAARRHEFSVRLALGASRERLMRQLLAESLLLSACGALLGMLFARWGSQLLVRQLSTSVNRVFLDLALDWRVLAFTAGIAVATALIAGTAPAWRATRVQPNEAIKEQGRTLVGEGRFGVGNALVVLQVALSLVLLVAAGLFIRTFASLATLDAGFQADPVLVASINAQRLQLEPDRRAGLFERLRQAAAAVPGVASAAASAVTPVSGSSWQFGIEAIDGTPVPQTHEDSRSTHVNLVSPDWFATYGTPILAGRDVATTDTAAAPKVAVVNEAFARKFLDGRNPLGRRIRQMGYPGSPSVEWEVVGYVRDAVYRSLREPVPPTLYLPIGQLREPPSFISVSIRAAGGSPALLTRSVAAALTGVSRDIAITFRPLADQIDASLTQERLVAMLSSFFGALALLLAGLGLYGVTSYAVNRRRAEIGIRMALGASPSGVVRLVLRRVALLVGAGVLAGLVLSLWAASFVGALLYGLQPRDPGTLAAAGVALAAIGTLAGWLPARRASRIDPAQVLRES